MGIHPRHYDNRPEFHSREVMARVLRDAAQFVHLTDEQIQHGLDMLVSERVAQDAREWSDLINWRWLKSCSPAHEFGVGACNYMGETFGSTCALCHAVSSPLLECHAASKFCYFITPRVLACDIVRPVGWRPGFRNWRIPYPVCEPCAAAAVAYIGKDRPEIGRAHLEGALAAVLVSRGFRKRVKDNASNALHSNPRQPLDAYMAREWAAA